MTYFIDPYKKYYEVLSQNNSALNSINKISDKLSKSDAIISKVDSYISNSNWKELGTGELSSSVIPNLKKNMGIFTSNFEILSKITSKAFDELLPETKKLKEADENYDEMVTKLKQLVVVPQYNSDGSVNPNYQTYINNKNNLINKRNEYIEKCQESIRNCNTIYNSIKSLDYSAEAIKETKKASSTSTTTGSSSSILESVEGGKLLKASVNGKEYYIANTRINALEYEQYVRKYNITQNGGVLSAECPILSQYYAMDMMRGTYTTGSQMNNYEKSPSTRINDTCSTKNRDEVLKYIYNETVNGRLTTLQATKIDTATTGGRHVVTVVGFDSSVQNYKDLNKDTILVLDCVDGKVQTLGQSRASGGHDRDIYAMGGEYLAHGATDDFLNKEVNNKEWQAKNGKGRTAA